MWVLIQDFRPFLSTIPTCCTLRITLISVLRALRANAEFVKKDAKKMEMALEGSRILREGS